MSNFIGIFALLLYTLNLIFWVTVLYLTALIRFIIPIPSFQKKMYLLMQQLPNYWIDGHDWIIKLTTNTKWEIEGLEDVQSQSLHPTSRGLSAGSRKNIKLNEIESVLKNLSPDKWYFLISNHQSWADILVLEKVFHHKIPTLKFFLKKQLIWLPFAGQACWLLDFPFMERTTREQLKKNPEMRDKDIKTVEKACEIFKRTPSTIINFLEGTRFTPEKHQKQSSPYQYLLKPKSSGVAAALSVLEGYVKEIIDVTIIYPNRPVTAWDFFCGRMKTVTVKIRVLPLPEKFCHAFVQDRHLRAEFQQWINQIWEEKDKEIKNKLKNT